MTNPFHTPLGPAAILLAAALATALPATARAHCDTLDGPVVSAARQALESGSVDPILAWVPAEHEPELRALFAHVLEVRALGDSARELADRHLFETLVRIHREGEGFPFTGLKPAGSPISPAVLAVDAALESGSADELLAKLEKSLAAGFHRRFARALEERAKSDESVAAGRRFVASYVELTHFAEAVEAILEGRSPDHGEVETQQSSHRHD